MKLTPTLTERDERALRTATYVLGIEAESRFGDNDSSQYGEARDLQHASKLIGELLEATLKGTTP